MSDWSKSAYEGEYQDGWYHGQGEFKYPNGVIYKGGFFKGEFHGEGTLNYPNGGQYKAKWVRGKMVEGDYFFDDNLKYEFENWDYCTEEKDRRFYYERQTGFDPKKYQSKLKPIPEGTYDVGDGYYDPVASIVYDYAGQVLRTPSEKEVEWIVSKCRYNPRTKLGVLKGENDRVIKKAIEVGRDPSLKEKKIEEAVERIEN